MSPGSYLNVTANQYIRQGAHVFSVVPDGQLEYVAISKIPAQNSGKIKLNQRVQILLDDYPYEEFGSITGKVESFSNINVEGSYLIRISLDSVSLNSTYNKKLNYRSEMLGTAEIITEDLRLMERLFYRLRSNLKTN